MKFVRETTVKREGPKGFSVIHSSPQMMMIIAFITTKRSLLHFIQGLCAQIYFRFEISVVCSHLFLFFFVKEKIC